MELAPWTDCATLQRAVLAWQRLAPEQKIRATVKVIGGHLLRGERKSPRPFAAGR
jgi:hypothetical protein